MDLNSIQVLLAICCVGTGLAVYEVFWKEGEKSLWIIAVSLLTCCLSLLRIWLLLVGGSLILP